MPAIVLTMCSYGNILQPLAQALDLARMTNTVGCPSVCWRMAGIGNASGKGLSDYGSETLISA
jgi:hypothetical protein